ncbi:hypothetical protein ACGP04_05415 [Piscirickettsia salmonis]|uniref:hypothetical protein n=1 Tax=Piscirickettsia salmonis TaxID=1238 RepID=UPI003752814C
MSVVDDLLHGLNESRQRELLEELVDVYNGSSLKQHINIEARERYRQLLREFGYKDRLNQFDRTEGEYSFLNHGMGFWPGVQFFPHWNSTRLLFIRIKSQLDAIEELLETTILKNSVGQANIGFSILGILWYLPRALRLTVLALKHLLTNKKSATDYFRKHWFQWFNDLVWAITGLITLGIGTGWYLGSWAMALGPGGIILTIAMCGFDVLNMAAKAYTKMRKMNRIIAHVNKEIKEICSGLDLAYFADIETLYVNIEKREQELIELIASRVSGQSNPDLALVDGIQKEQAAIEKLKDLVDIKERILLKKAYLEYDQLIGIGTSIGFLVGLALILTGPIGTAIGASLILITCGIQYWLNHYFLPKKEIQLAADPLELLHLKLDGHVDAQIAKLTKVFDQLGEGSEKAQTEPKLQTYMAAKAELESWQTMPDRNSHSDKLHQAMSLAMDASKICRRGNGAPSSYKALKAELKYFTVDWQDRYKQTQIKFNPLLKDFLSSSKIKPSAENDRMTSLIFQDSFIADGAVSGASGVFSAPTSLV